MDAEIRELDAAELDFVVGGGLFQKIVTTAYKIGAAILGMESSADSGPGQNCLSSN